MYKKKCTEYEPDKTGGIYFYQERLKEVEIAYKVLEDDEKRKEYDDARNKLLFSTGQSE